MTILARLRDPISNKVESLAFIAQTNQIKDHCEWRKSLKIPLNKCYRETMQILKIPKGTKSCLQRKSFNETFQF